MSSMDPMRGDSWILSEIMRRTSLRPFRLRQLLNTKSSSSMRQITHPMMYNSYLGRLLRNLPVTADSSSPATTRTKFLNLSIPVVPSLNLASKAKTDSQSLPTFLNGFGKFSTQKEWSTTTKYSLNFINKHFPDWRRVLNEIQRYSVGGKIDSGILATFSDVAVNELVKNLKD